MPESRHGQEKRLSTHWGGGERSCPMGARDSGKSGKKKKKWTQAYYKAWTEKYDTVRAVLEGQPKLAMECRRMFWISHPSKHPTA